MVANGFDHLGVKMHQPLRIAEQLLPLLGRRDVAAIAIQKADAEDILQLSNPHGDSGLGRVEPLGGAAETAQRRDPDESLDGLQVSHAEQATTLDKSFLSRTI